jgi:hypothetical protein
MERGRVKIREMVIDREMAPARFLALLAGGLILLILEARKEDAGPPVKSCKAATNSQLYPRYSKYVT